MAYQNRFEDEPTETPSPKGPFREPDEEMTLLNFHHTIGTKIQDAVLTVSGPYTGRVGMDKNFRVGVVKFITSKNFDEHQKILIDGYEECYNKLGEKYPANYNLWISIPKDHQGTFNRDIVGKHCLVGFYMGALRDKDQNAKYDNHFQLKHFELITEEQSINYAAQLHDNKHITNKQNKKWEEDQQVTTTVNYSLFRSKD